MGILAALKTDETIAQETDVVGGGFAPFASGIYPFTVVLAYLLKSKSEALGLHLVLQDDTSKELKEAIYLTSGKAKGGLNTYIDKNTKEKHYLPGFLLGNSLALLTVGKELSELDTEEKVIQAWSKDAKQEVPTKVDMITELIGKPIYGAVQLQLVTKQVKADDGSYVDTEGTREVNELVKFFRAADRMTVAELRAKADTPVFFQSWLDKWKDVTRDRTSKSTGTAGAPGAAGAPAKAASGGAGKPTSSLFQS